MSFRDLSILVNFALVKNDFKLPEKCPFKVQSITNGQFKIIYELKLIDFDLKSVKKLKEWKEMDINLLTQVLDYIRVKKLQ